MKDGGGGRVGGSSSQLGVGRLVMLTIIALKFLREQLTKSSDQ